MKNKILMLAALIVASAGMANAQQVAPIYSEAKMKHSVKGEFTVVNAGLTSMPVVVEAKELIAGKDGAPGFQALSPDVRVEMKDTSAVIPPKAQRAFEYKIECQRNCAVSFFSGMTTGKSKEGIAIRLWIPSTVYACTDKAVGCRIRTKALLNITQ